MMESAWMSLGGAGGGTPNGDAWGVSGEDVTSAIGRTGSVGIGTTTPQTKLDVRAANHNGAVSATDGILVPRVNDLVANGTINGQLVYLIADAGNYYQGFHYWDGSRWIAVNKSSKSTEFQIGETKYFKFTGVPLSTFVNPVPSRTIMSGNNFTTTTTSALLSETAGFTNSTPGIIFIEGLRMDYLATSTGSMAPIFVNTTANNVTFSVSTIASLTSTLAQKNNGARLTIFANTIGSIDNITGSSLQLSENSSFNTVFSQVIFPNGRWYQISYGAVNLDGLINAYISATRLQ